MGRSMINDKTDKSSDKNRTSESDSDSDLEEEEYVVEKILDMRKTRKGKIQCK